MKKQEKKPKKGPSYGSLWRQFGSQITGTVLILMVIVALYSALADRTTTPAALPLSELAQAVTKGEVKSVTVNGDILNVE